MCRQKNDDCRSGAAAIALAIAVIAGVAPASPAGARARSPKPGGSPRRSPRAARALARLMLLAPAWNFEPEDYEASRGDRKVPPEDAGTDHCRAHLEEEVGHPLQAASAQQVRAADPARAVQAGRQELQKEPAAEGGGE